VSFPWPYRRIATEEAFSVPEVYEALRGWAATADPAEPDQDFWDFVFTQDHAGLQRVRRQLLDVEHERLEIMDTNGVDVQLLSRCLLRNVRMARYYRLARNSHTGISSKPAAGHAVAARGGFRDTGPVNREPTARPRCRGWNLRAPGRGGCQQLAHRHRIAGRDDVLADPGGRGDVRHSGRRSPRFPGSQTAAAFKKYGLETGIWGFQADTGLHGLRLICGGVFDRFPGLRIVLGHLGEGLPYWLYRLDYLYPVRSSYRTRPVLSLTPSEYIKRNFAITTSGMNWAPVLRFCIEAVGADNIMFAIDYPYQATEGAVRFLDEAEISDEDRRKIYHRNAEPIFGIPDGGESGEPA